MQDKIGTINAFKARIIKPFENSDFDIENQDLNENVLDLISKIEIISEKLINISQQNLNLLLFVQDNLIENYKQRLKESLKIQWLNKENIKNLGNSLIGSKKVSTIKYLITRVQSLTTQEWLNLIESLKYNSQFQGLLKNLKRFYQSNLLKKLNEQLEKFPKDFETSLKEKFKEEFLENPNLTVSSFIKKYSTKAIKNKVKISQTSQQNLKKREELKKLKENQKDYGIDFEEYFQLSEEEFEIKKRRAFRKKLPEIDKSKIDSHKKLEISEDISEKIKKFKLQYDKKFGKKFIYEDKDEKDPIEIIRERKRKKEIEFEKYKKRFEKQKED